ncbi:hypothetical protein [Pseudactinotalea sp. Z1748]|uniref:hypothetical protein n=1 Tax=Pseudactinotalea sp. Z1748 TaxID=3413027 RepID=UPI003C7C1BAE
MLTELVWLVAGCYLALAMAAGGIWLIVSWARDVRAARRREQNGRARAPVA